MLGIAYKKNVSDYRESPALEIIELLMKQGSDVSYSDPFVPEFRLHDRVLKSISPADPGNFDLAILVTNHDQFDPQALLNQFPVILDTRNAFKGITSDRVIRI